MGPSLAICTQTSDKLIINISLWAWKMKTKPLDLAVEIKCTMTLADEYWVT